MRLEKVEIHDFRSIHNSNEFEVGDVTCLVGKNEAGKTAILQALYRLNPVISAHGKFDVTFDYPKSEVEDYRQAVEKEKRKPANVVKATFSLDDTDTKPVRAVFGEQVFTSNTFTATKGYENTFRYTLPIDEAKVLKSALKDAKVSKELAHAMSSIETFAALSDFLAKHIATNQAAYDAAIEAANTATEEKSKTKALQDAKLHTVSDELKALAELSSHIKAAENIRKYVWQEFLSERMPKFLYFDEYYQMKGAVNIEALQAREEEDKLTESDYPMLGLIELARLNLASLISPKQTMELINNLQGASNHISKQILKYWSQNQHIRLTFDVRPGASGDPLGMQKGTNLWGFVYDDIHLVSTTLGSRSRGFIWFFSFLAWYSQQKKENSEIILLLDEPGLSLHASAQADFLRYVEAELKPHHQVIYTTHSPFLVDAKHFDRVRTVEDKSMQSEEPLPLDQRGTKVSTDVLDVAKGTLFPLQGALGYEIAQSLFIGPNSLIVEGVSDLLYLQTISSLLASNGREGLKKEWIITPVGGSDKVPTFASLIGVQPGMNVATLIDLQKKDQQSIENLYKRKLLEKSHVFTYADFTGQKEADVEDMFEPDFYLRLVNEEYGTTLGGTLATSDLKSGGVRILPRIEALLQQRNTANLFNHYRPSRYFSEKSGTLSADLSPETLNRFEKAFKAINRLIG